MGNMNGMIFVMVVLLMVYGVSCDLDSHHYKPREKVHLWANRVGPYQNPQEVYTYYSLPFCQPNKMIESTHETLGEALLSYDLILSPINIYFREDMEDELLCTRVDLNKKETALFQYAIRHQYWFQMFLDDLPMWGMVGEVVEDSPMIFSHIDLCLTYNDDQIITVNLTMDKLVKVSEGGDLPFTYSVRWEKSEIAFNDRFSVYMDMPFFEHQIHWFSILNSFMMLTFLVGFVGMILVRTLRKDYARFEDSETNADDEHGWKQIQGDVFRKPNHLLLFTAMVGTGHQLFFLIIFVLLVSFWGTYYVETRGSLSTAFIVSYALTSFIAGYASGGYYSRNSGKRWIKAMLLTSVLFPGTCLACAVILNWVAALYQSASKIESSSLIILICIWTFISLPLTLFGTLLGKNWSGESDSPCHVNKNPRPIPSVPWYSGMWVNIVMGGVLPFGSIFIEMFFIFASFWHYKYYHLYGFLFLVFVILVCVTVCSTVVSTYFLLNSEDYRWKWVSFLSGASTAVYVFLYAVYFFFTKTKMSGFFQIVFYFTYTFLCCFGLFLLCGTIGFVGSAVFVKRIYRNVKGD